MQTQNPALSKGSVMNIFLIVTLAVGILLIAAPIAFRPQNHGPENRHQK